MCVCVCVCVCACARVRARVHVRAYVHSGKTCNTYRSAAACHVQPQPLMEKHSEGQPLQDHLQTVLAKKYI